MSLMIEGGRRLSGDLTVQGAKNSVLPILAACILSGDVCVLQRCPHLEDVDTSIDILRHLGCAVRWNGPDLEVDSSTLTRWDIPDRLMRRMRSSVVFLGAILARCGQAELSYPGGCAIGARPIDLHLSALRTLGACIREEGGSLDCTASGLAGAEIVLSIPSVGATENAMLAACGAEGTTVISNAAREPEIVDLQAFLLALGAEVRGAGSSVVTVRGGNVLHGGEHTVMPDRIVAATLLSAVASAGGEAEILGTDYRQLSTVTAVLAEAGCRIRSGADYITIRRDGLLKGVRPIRTAPYPGFPTDAQPPVMAALTRSEGTTVIVENMFESRYRHVDELCRMGADIRVEGRVAVICGVDRLRGTGLKAADLRGGAALVVAALGADGRSEITGLTHIDRGYYGLDETLRGLGAGITRA